MTTRIKQPLFTRHQASFGAVGLLRPSPLAGLYPQRQDQYVGWLDTLASKFAGSIRGLISVQANTSDRFISAVNELEADLSECSTDDLARHINLLRQRLHNQGFEYRFIIESFAIIREVSKRQLGLRHHDEQLLGGFAMLKGRIAEMDTGEGKSLTALLPACTAAMAGVPVHIITVNDFLVTRDADELAPIYRFLGLSVGKVTEPLDLDQRRAAYRADITYTTNKQIVFDYLKDTMLLEQESRPLHMRLEGLYRLSPRAERLILRGLCFAIVDEADSVLIDEAITPLIISGPGNTPDEALYHEALTIARQLKHDDDFIVHANERRIDLTNLGLEHITACCIDYGHRWSSKRKQREWVSQALTALYLYQADIHYLVKNNTIVIIDEFTGRLMADRSWERGLHQMIEAKEHCPISGRKETLARISYQRFFKRYIRLCGMTGTAREVTAELWSVYRLGVERIPTHRPSQRKAIPDQCFFTANAKWSAVVATIAEIHRQGRPILVGTRTVDDSEQLSTRLRAAGLEHVVLNARQDAQEAEIIARAGGWGNITVATNMAGRGTDIRLEPTLSAMGGLHVISTNYHEARRIDRQLFGRCGRQGDSGSYQTIVSLEDDIFSHYLWKTWLVLLSSVYDKQRTLPEWPSICLRSIVQWRAERQHSTVRNALLSSDEELANTLAFSGRSE